MSLSPIRGRLAATLLLVFSLGCCVDQPVDNPPDLANSQPETPASPSPSLAMTIPKSTKGQFARSVSFDGKPLRLNGSGLCEWGWFKVDLYYGALFAEEPIANCEAALASDQVLVIHLEFLRKLTDKQLGQAFTASVKVNAGPEAEKDPSLAQLVNAMRTVQIGDRYTFISDPKRGLLVQHNDTVVTNIKDQAFRKLFIRLYLGDKPPTTALRNGMLGA